MRYAVRTTTRIAFVVMLALATCGCASRDNVKVTDAVTGKPVAGAKVMPIYPSFGGGTYKTNAKGVVHVGGFGIPRGGHGVEVTAVGYEKYFFGTYPTAENHSGWRGDNLDVALQPAVRP